MYELTWIENGRLHFLTAPSYFQALHLLQQLIDIGVRVRIWCNEKLVHTVRRVAHLGDSAKWAFLVRG